MKSIIILFLFSLISVSSSNWGGIEICDNGIDDDGDLLVDSYDPDCQDFIYPSCNPPFINNNISNCSSEFLNDSIILEEVWRYHGISAAGVPIVGDFDGDCHPEVLMRNWPVSDKIVIINGQNGSLKYEYRIQNGRTGQGHPALADTDEDGYGEFFFLTLESDEIYLNRIDFNPSLPDPIEFQWKSNETIKSNYTTDPIRFIISIADFNRDGNPEIVVGNQIFNSESGIELTNGGSNNQGNYVIGTSNFMAAITFAVDVLDENHCNTCDGLELVAGNQVYAIDIQSSTNPALNSATVVRELAQEKDGATRIVDFDRDGDLDAVVTTQRTWSADSRLYIWDLQTENYVGNPIDDLPNRSGNERIGPVSIADIDSDSWPEIAVTTSRRLIILEDYASLGNDWGLNASNTIKKVLNTSDGSGATGLTFYDTDGNGSLELYYRDESTLRIFDSDLNVITSYTCASGTAIEYPVIADLLGDGGQEILCTCRDDDLLVLNNKKRSLLKARKVWNQYNYFVTNINDDLTVPREQQLHHIAGNSVQFNAVLFQTSILDTSFTPVVNLPDILIDNYEINCFEDSLSIEIEYCNVSGNSILSEIFFSIYTQNPLSDNISAFYSFERNSNLVSDTCLTTTFTIPSFPFQDSLYIILNDQGSLTGPFDLENSLPDLSFDECSYKNNFLAIPFITDTILHSNKFDTTFCNGDTIYLSPELIFSNITWSNGSEIDSIEVWEPGIYWAKSFGECNNLYVDTFEVVVSTDLALINEFQFEICEGDSLEIQLPLGLLEVSWDNDIYVSCDSCLNVLLFPQSDHIFYVSGLSADGCYLYDSLYIVVNQSFLTELSDTICPFDTIYPFGYPVFIPGLYEETFTTSGNCDSTIILNLTSASNKIHFDSIIICKGDSAFIFNKFEKQSGIFIERYPIAGQCDSISSIHLILNKPDTSFSNNSICHGDSLFLFGNWIKTEGIYTDVNVNSRGCDSISIASLNVYDTYLFTDSISICEGDTIYFQNRPIYSGGSYEEKFTTAHGCDSTYLLFVTEISLPEIQLLSTRSCYDHPSGSAYIEFTGDPPPHSINWSTGEFDKDSIGPLLPGIYWVTVSYLSLCEEVDSVHIQGYPNPVVDYLVSRPSCDSPNANLSIIANDTGLTFSLDNLNFQTEKEFLNLSEGMYTLYVLSDQLCNQSFMFEVLEGGSNFNASIPNVYHANIGEVLTLSPSVNGLITDLQFTWSPSSGLDCDTCIHPTLLVSGNQDYSLHITDAKGCDTTIFTSILVAENVDIYIPNAFSPNGDGVNEYFTFYAGGEISRIISFKVFNRWGDKVFERNNISNLGFYGWDGTFQGKKMNPDVFVYMIEIEFLTGTKQLYTGDFLLAD